MSKVSGGPPSKAGLELVSISLRNAKEHYGICGLDCSSSAKSLAVYEGSLAFTVCLSFLSRGSKKPPQMFFCCCCNGHSLIYIYIYIYVKVEHPHGSHMSPEVSSGLHMLAWKCEHGMSTERPRRIPWLKHGSKSARAGCLCGLFSHW